MNINIISASPRQQSNSLRFSKYLSSEFKVLSSEASVTITDFADCDIPVVGRGSITRETFTTFQREMIANWANAELVIMVLPEYNFGTSGEFKNALDQLGGKDFAHLFNDKVFAMVGTSSGRGGRMPCHEIGTVVNKLINFLSQYAFVSPRFLEAHETPKNIDSNFQSVGNAIFEKSVKDFAQYSLVMAERW